MDRFEAIKNFRKMEDEKALAKAKSDEEYRVSLVNAIEFLAPRIRKMYELAQALVVAHIPLGKPTAGDNLGSGTTNCTDGINHLIGFYVQDPYHTMGLPNYTLKGYYGRENGGVCGDIDLKIDCITGKIVEGDHLVRYMQWFLDGFDKAEKEFYDYVDTTIGYKE